MLEEGLAFQIAFGGEFQRAVPTAIGPPAVYPQTGLNQLWWLRTIQEAGHSSPYRTLIFIKCWLVSARIELCETFSAVSPSPPGYSLS
jgi:hypothetical protein